METGWALKSFQSKSFRDSVTLEYGRIPSFLSSSFPFCVIMNSFLPMLCGSHLSSCQKDEMKCTAIHAVFVCIRPVVLQEYSTACLRDEMAELGFSQMIYKSKFFLGGGPCCGEKVTFLYRSMHVGCVHAVSQFPSHHPCNLFACSVFWDLYCAAPERRETCEHSSEAKAFHDYVSLCVFTMASLIACINVVEKYFCTAVAQKHRRWSYVTLSFLGIP